MRAGRDSSPELLGAFALVKLLDEGNRPERLRSAIDLLEQATSQPGAGAHLWSDLAATYLESAEQGAAWNYPRSLEAALRAVEVDGKLPEARFNLALALEKSFLEDKARSAWAAIEESEEDSGWRKEAVVHRRHLEGPSRIALWEKRSAELDLAALREDRDAVRKLVIEFPYRARVHAEHELLPAWARAQADGQIEKARQKLQEARAVGAVVADVTGEHMVKDSVAAIDRCVLDLTSLATLASAYIDYARGADLCLENEGIQGEPLLERSREVLAHAGDPMSAWADYNLGLCAYQRSERRMAIEHLNGVLKRPDLGRYPSLNGRTYWMIGLAHSVLGEPAAAEEAYKAALPWFEKAKAVPEVAGLDYLMAETQLFMGERRQAWISLHHGLGLTVEEGDVRRLYAALDQAADATAQEGLLDAALVYRDEVVKVALRPGDAPGVAHALLRRAETQLQAGHRSAARRDLKRARSVCRRIDDADERSHREGDILFVEGKLLARDNPSAAVATLGKAIEIYQRIDYRFPIVEVYLVRARAFLATDQAASAERDLIAGIREFERQRGELKNEEQRIVHFDQARDLFDLLIDLQADRPEGVETAFDSTEQQRARVLLDRTQPGQLARPASLREVQHGLPSGVFLVVYSSLPERLLIWTLSRNAEPMMVSVSVSASALEALVSACRRNIQRRAPEGEMEAQLSALHEVLLEPIISRIPTGARIVFVPDKALHRVPFAALRDGVTKRFLVESHASGVSPSASLYVEGAGRAQMEGKPGLLVIADPSFNRQRFSDLSRLDGAAAEGEAIATLIPERSRVLLGEEATRAAFLREVERWPFLHLGVHALLNPDHPHLSRLLQASTGPRDPGTLTAADIQGLPLAGTRLVFLASCRSGGGPLASEGVLSLTRAFLAAGAREVVSSLWDLDDKPAAVIALDFYRRLLRGEDAQEALRQTQLQALRSGRRDVGSIPVWAAFEVSGSGVKSHQ